MSTATAEKNAKTTSKDDIKPIDQEIVNMAAAITAELKVDPKTGVGTLSRADVYEALLPEGLTAQIVADVRAHDGKMAAAGLLALGEATVPLMKKHKDLTSTTLTIPATGKDSFSFSMSRERQVPDKGVDGTYGTKTKYGSGTAEFNMYGTKTNGQLKTVKQTLAAAALASFGS